MKKERTVKIAEEIKKKIMKMILEGDIKNREILDSNAIISITRLDVVRDLKYAYVYVSILGGNHQKILEAFQKSAGYIRSEVGKAVKLRYTPELIFRLDTSIKDGVEMIKFIDEVNHKDEKR